MDSAMDGDGDLISFVSDRLIELFGYSKASDVWSIINAAKRCSSLVDLVKRLWEIGFQDSTSTNNFAFALYAAMIHDHSKSSATAVLPGRVDEGCDSLAWGYLLSLVGCAIRRAEDSLEILERIAELIGQETDAHTTLYRHLDSLLMEVASGAYPEPVLCAGAKLLTVLLDGPEPFTPALVEVIEKIHSELIPSKRVGPIEECRAYIQMIIDLLVLVTQHPAGFIVLDKEKPSCCPEEDASTSATVLKTAGTAIHSAMFRMHDAKLMMTFALYHGSYALMRTLRESRDAADHAHHAQAALCEVKAVLELLNYLDAVIRLARLACATTDA